MKKENLKRKRNIALTPHIIGKNRNEKKENKGICGWLETAPPWLSRRALGSDVVARDCRFKPPLP